MANILVASDKPSVCAVLGKANPLVMLVHLIVTVLVVKSQLQVAGQFEPNEAAFILFIVISDMKKNSVDFIFFSLWLFENLFKSIIFAIELKIVLIILGVHIEYKKILNFISKINYFK